MTKEFKVNAPTAEAKGPRYDAECRSALKPAFETLLDIAVEADWNRTRTAYELMYLASHHIAEDRDGKKRAS
ncbi:MAG: hypothetical protein QM744_16375 [Mesorhizobium sp.]